MTAMMTWATLPKGGGSGIRVTSQYNKPQMMHAMSRETRMEITESLRTAIGCSD
jgi:hypothetical protein